jgi:hypothetical protein
MAQTERAKCYYITIPGMIQGKISAERGKIAQNQPIRGMISADFRLTAARQSVFAKFRFLYYIGLDGMRAGRIATARHVQPPAAQNHHGTPLPSTIRANAPRRAPFCPFGVFALRSAAQSGMMKSAEIAF